MLIEVTTSAIFTVSSKGRIILTVKGRFLAEETWRPIVSSNCYVTVDFYDWLLTSQKLLCARLNFNARNLADLIWLLISREFCCHFSALIHNFTCQIIEISGNAFFHNNSQQSVLVIKLIKKRNETNLKISGSLVELNSFFFFFKKFSFSSFRIFWAIRPHLLFRTVIYLFIFCFEAWYSAPAVSTHSDNHN